MALRRQVKNVVKNFSDIEVKVREATSNDPWGPSSSLTAEIADATYNVQAFAETMQLLWKRINDHGKNWRHVYKSLVVLDYIIKTGSDRVAQQCRENIFAIKTLKDFQFIDKDGKDQGINVREKSKQLVELLKDEERLKSERQRALKAKERFYQSEGGIGNVSYPKNKKFQASTKYTDTKGSVDDSNLPPRTWPELDQNSDSRSTDGRIDSEIEKVRPSNEAEEEMQLQIALAMSREEAEIDGVPDQPSELKLPPVENLSLQPPAATTGTLLNLTDATPPPINTTENIFDPWGKPVPAADPMPSIALPQPSVDPWGMPSSAPVNPGFTSQPINALGFPSQQPMSTGFPVQQQPVPVDPWAPAPVKPLDPWGTSPVPEVAMPPPVLAPVLNEPALAPLPLTSDPWGIPPTSAPAPAPALVPSPSLADPFAPLPLDVPASAGPDLFSLDPEIDDEPKKAVSPAESFLANGSHLVNVDNIFATSEVAAAGTNPFQLSSSSGSGSSTNPFLQDKPKAKSINEMRNAKTTMFGVQPVSQPINFQNDILLPTPMAPSMTSTAMQGNHNPFLS